MGKSSFELFMRGSVGSDCTARYNVVLNKEYTVREFVNDVLSREGDWGYIGIPDGKTIFGDPRCEYKHGILLYDFPEEVKGKKVLSVSASGGYSRMDYLLMV